MELRYLDKSNTYLEALMDNLLYLYFVGKCKYAQDLYLPLNSSTASGSTASVGDNSVGAML